MSIAYVARRLLQLALMVVIAVTINFLVPRLIPGGPAGRPSLRARLGLDDPLWQQYQAYWRSLARLDLGVSAVDYPATVAQTILGALPWTLGLLTVSTLLAFTLGTLLGALLAWPGAPRGLRLLSGPLLALSSIPPFLLAILLVLAFVIEIPIFPPAGPYDPLLIPRLNLATALDILAHALLPSITLVLSGAGLWALTMRGQMVSVLGEDYIAFAEAKGLSPARVFFAYGLRNALLPQVTGLAVTLGVVLSGAFMVEVIFSYPGLGGLLYQAIIARDLFVMQGIALLAIVALALALFVLDLVYPLLDPRIGMRET